jgi:hypothetical protein
MFASYPVRRLEAEVLLDCALPLTGTAEGYNSPIPEPFTYIPASPPARSIWPTRPSPARSSKCSAARRATGHVMERNNRISDAQRLHLLNSSQVQDKIERSWRFAAHPQQNRTEPFGSCAGLWMTVLSRPPLHAEEQEAIDHGTGSGIKTSRR